MKFKTIPSVIKIIKPYSDISWFNHLIGETFEVLNYSKYGSVEICYNKELQLYGLVPLECCDHHLQLVK